MTTFATAAALLLVALLLPLLLLAYATESRAQRIRRLRSYGWSQAAIAARCGCSRATVQRQLSRLA